jgi:hypothetical protein
MSLIHDIQAAAIARDHDVPTLLRMCKLLAARISHQAFGEWIDCQFYFGRVGQFSTGVDS